MIRQKKKVITPGTVIMLVVAALLLGIAGVLGYSLYLDKAYPMEYSEYVEKYSKEYGVDKFLVYAVIKTESGFRADAVSNVGARGLMQITEVTFDWIKLRLGDSESEFYDMYNPETNIRYGCWFLGFLCEEFGNIETVAAAYHAGRGKVNEWLGNKNYSRDGVHLDTIPGRDTAHYVSKVTGAVDIYIRLYDN